MPQKTRTSKGSSHRPRYEVKVILWQGRKFRVIRVLDDNDTKYVGENDLGRVSPTDGYIAFRARDPDVEVMVLFHEMMHVAHPKIRDEKAIELAEPIYKTFLEAMGLDLYVMLRGFEPVE